MISLGIIFYMKERFKKQFPFIFFKIHKNEKKFKKMEKKRPDEMEMAKKNYES